MVGVDEVTDSRFKLQHADPRFQSVPKAKRKVKIDDRFKAMLDSNSAFARKSVTDKYGRKVKHEIKEDLGDFYDIDDDDGEDAEPAFVKQVNANQKSKSNGKSKLDDNALDESSNRKTEKKKKTMEGSVKSSSEQSKKLANGSASFDPISMKLKNQDLRTAMLDWASSSSDDEFDDKEDLEEELAAQEALDISQPLVPVTETIKSGEETKRLALLNMDWSRVQAVDILMLLRSFAPSTGDVLSVKVYASEFGKERMEAERRRGPGEFIGDGDEDEDEGEDIDGDEKKQKIDMVKLRKYEAEKLKYYYAVAECDSVRTAMGIYAQCDGVEYEASSNVLDLRYIPDEETFDDEPHAEAEEAPEDYASPFFQNHAMGHTNVQLTWDQDDPKREVLRGKGLSGGKGKKGKREQEHQMIDYTPFLASSDSEGSDTEDHAREKARSLLLQAGRTSDAFGSKGDADEEQTDMVVTFTPGLASLGEKLQKKKAKLEEAAAMTVWEQYQKKRADKKKAKRGKRKGEEDEEGEDDDGLYDDAGPDDLEGSAFVDDSVFEDDPFFQLPDQGPAAKQERGMWKKKKGPREVAREEEEEEEDAQTVKERQRAQLELLMMDDSGAAKRGYSIKPTALGRASERAGVEAQKKKKRKGKGKKGEGEEGGGGEAFEVDVRDNRFSSVFSDPRFALDPTDPQFGKSPGLRKLLDEGRARRAEQGKRKAERKEASGSTDVEDGAPQKKKGKVDAELAALVSTLKRRQR